LKNKASLCAQCKGARRLCGRPTCPILERIRENVRVASAITRREVFGSSPPSLLVGEWGYPRIRLGPLIPPVTGLDAREYDNPVVWWGRKTIEDIIRLRSSLILTESFVDARLDAKRPDRLLEEIQELALSALPVDAEARLRRRPTARLRFDGVLSPVGPRAPLERLRIVGNPSVPRKVDQIVYDTDAKAAIAVEELYRYGVSPYHIVRLLSVGLLGEAKQRRIVPTRWAITATDTILGNILLRRIRGYPEIDDIELYYTEYLGNRYAIVMCPGSWSFEMIEIWLPRSVWVGGGAPYICVNYELWDGKCRVPGVDGGYHAIRFPVLERLFERRRQATVIAIREVTPEYYAPLGSWQIRESVRNALRQKKRVFNSVMDALKAAARRLDTGLDKIIASSHLLKHLSGQTRIDRFLQS